MGGGQVGHLLREGVSAGGDLDSGRGFGRHLVLSEDISLKRRCPGRDLTLHLV